MCRLSWVCRCRATLEMGADHSVHVQAGGLPPLLELMASRNGNLQHNAAFALYGLADNEDNIAAIVREGGVQCLQDCELLVQVMPHPTQLFPYYPGTAG